MTLGLSLAAFTAVHVVISLIGILTGFLAIFAMFKGSTPKGLAGLFLLTTILTSVTGFLFPFNGVTPGIILGVLSMIALAIAVVAFYVRGLAGSWRSVYALTAVIAQYFNVFVLFAQLFAKTPALKAIAPTQASPVFGATQLAVLVIFILLGRKAFKGMRA